MRVTTPSPSSSANRPQQARPARTGNRVAQPGSSTTTSRQPPSSDTGFACAAVGGADQRRPLRRTRSAPRATPGSPSAAQHVVERRRQRPRLVRPCARCARVMRDHRAVLRAAAPGRAAAPAGGPPADVSTVWPAGRWCSSASLRSGSSSENTSSSSSTGGVPVSAVTTWCAASRSASASERCSPCDACVRAGRPAMLELQLVAVRADGRHPATQVVASRVSRARRPVPSPPTATRSATSTSTSASTASDRVRVRDERRRAARRARAGPRRAPRRLGQLGVPDVEGEAADSSKRLPPADCFSRALRWRRIRSTSDRSWS